MRLVDRVIDNNKRLVLFDDIANEYYTYHTKGTKNFFNEAKKNLIILERAKVGYQQDFIRDLITDFESIIKATPSLIPNIITKYTTGNYLFFVSDSVFRKEIENAYNYSGFRKSAKASWFAERFEIKSCLYCNAQFTLSIGKDGRKKRLLFQLDHFFNKSKLPFLSLTVGNLIPSCSTCNISKSNKEFTLNTHIHPYHEDANIKFDFYIDENKALEYLLGNRDYKLLEPQVRIIDNKFLIHKSTFYIDEIYKKHTDIIEELILKSLYYNKSKRAEIESELKGLNFSQSIIDRFVLGNYSLDSEINKRPLAKLAKDIGKQLKII